MTSIERVISCACRRQSSHTTTRLFSPKNFAFSKKFLNGPEDAKGQ
jgi:hypothetical protein